MKMTDGILEDFPRGGNSAKEKVTKKRKRVDDDFQYKSQDELFKESKQKRAKTVKCREEEETSFSEVLGPGILVLGCVREVRDFDLAVSLPNGFQGTIPITDICESYTSLLQKLAEGNDIDLAEDKSLLSLHDIFHVGSIVRCKVKDISLKGKRKIVTLTINPKEVNRNITTVQKGMVLTGCVSSCEDHGFLIDLGLNVKAFLSKDAATEYISGLGSDLKDLSIGSYLHCKVVDNGLDKNIGRSQVIKISVDPELVCGAMLDKSMKLSIQSLLPGSVCNATVKKVLENCITIQFLSFNGTVNKQHLRMPLKAYEVGAEIEVAVLFINPLTKVLSLSELPHLVSAGLRPDSLFGSLIVGDILEEAVVSHIDKRRGVYFRLPDKIKAFAKMAELPGKTVKSLQQHYQKGSKHKCRILHFDYMSKLAFVSLKDEVISLEFFSYSDVKPGILLECTVEKLLKVGASVSITKRVRGFIPNMHLADVPLAKPEKKFYPGKKLKCKVLVVDPKKSKLQMTCKKSLIKSSLPAITDYEQCIKGSTVEGFVASIKPNGLVVVFFNGIKGWIPKEEASFEEVSDPRRLFYLGQVVKCQVVKSIPVDQKLILSLKRNSVKAPVDQIIPQDLVVGKITSCVIRKVEASGLQVELPGGVLALLPRMHLSDSYSNVCQVHKLYHEGDAIEQIMVFDRKGKSVTVTRKTSIIQFCLKGDLVTDFSQFQPGIILPGVVRKKMPYGLFVDINGLHGLAPTKYLIDEAHRDPLSLFSEGQSLMAKVTEVDKERKRFLLSLRMSDCYHGDTVVGIDLLKNYFKEYKDILNSVTTVKDGMSELGCLTIGSVVRVQITNVNDKGILCQTTKQVKGFATTDNMSGVVCQVGEEHEAVVLFVDTEADCVQLSLNQEFVTAVKKFIDNKYSKAKVGQVIKSVVHLVTSDFVLVVLKGHAAGRIAFLPAKRHLNDILEKLQYHVGQENAVIVKSEFEGHIFANLQIHETDAQDRSSRTALPDLGSLVKARVLHIYPMQMNVAIGSYSGRVHVTAVCDEIKSEMSPFVSFSEGQELKVKVIGYREEKTHKFLPNNLAKNRKVLLECSMRPSILHSDVIEDILHPKINVGDEVNGFVITIEKNCIRMQITWTMKGTVHILNASDKLKVLSNAANHFKVGCGFKVRVLAIANNDLELTIADRRDMLQIDDIVPAIILKLIPQKGLLLQLPHRQIGDVHLTELSDQFIDFAQHNFKTNQFIRCRLISTNAGPRLKWNASLRKSRLEEDFPLNASDREISSFDSFKQGDICHGYIVSNRNNDFLVSFSISVTGRVKRGHLSKYSIPDVNSIFPLGKVVTAKILSLDPVSKYFELSLLESDTLVPESIPQHIAKDLSLLNAADEEGEHDMEHDSLSPEKPFLRLFCSVNDKTKQSSKKIVQKEASSATKAVSSENFWNDKYLQQNDVEDDDQSDDSSIEDLEMSS